MPTVNKPRRPITTGPDFMNYRINDLFYALLVCESSLDQEQERYLTKKAYYDRKIPELISKVRNVSSRTVERWLQKLICQGLVQEKDKEGIGPCFMFPISPQYPFQYVNLDLMKMFVSSFNEQAFQIYVYLLHKYQYKSGYEFTLQELEQQALQYKQTSETQRKYLKATLNTLIVMGVIRFAKIAKTINGRSVFYFKLDFMATQLSELLEENNISDTQLLKI